MKWFVALIKEFEFEFVYTNDMISVLCFLDSSFIEEEWNGMEWRRVFV